MTNVETIDVIENGNTIDSIDDESSFDLVTGEVVIGNDDAEFSFDLTDTDGTANIETDGGEVIIEEGGVTTEVNLIEGGVQVMHTIDDMSSAHEFTINLQLNDFDTLVENSNGEYQIIDGDGNNVALIGKPWAVDANGTFLETEYIIEGTTLKQVVYTTPNTVAYPITADPLFCSQTIKSTTWNKDYDINKNDNAGSLKVIPNTCARVYITANYLRAVMSSAVMATFSQTAISKDMWNEIKSSSHYKSKITSSTSGRIWDQFICHAWNPQATWFEKSWDLEPKRKDLSLWDTYLHKCNPPKA